MERRCPLGHDLPGPSPHCPTCGAKTVEATPVTAIAEVDNALRGDTPDPSAKDRPRARRTWLIVGSAAAVALLVVIIVVAKSQQTTPKESAADFYADVPQGEDAWFKVQEACGFEPGTTLVDYQPGADLSGAYDYEDANGNPGTAIVSLNGYGAIAWVDTCRYIDGAPVSYSERKRVDWGR